MEWTMISPSEREVLEAITTAQGAALDRLIASMEPVFPQVEREPYANHSAISRDYHNHLTGRCLSDHCDYCEVPDAGV